MYQEDNEIAKEMEDSEECKFQHTCGNYTPHPKWKYCLDDQCPDNDFDNFVVKSLNEHRQI